MTTDTIITDGLAAMADEQEFRRWMTEFDCIEKQHVGYCALGALYEFTGSLAELAFELRKTCWRTHIPLTTYQDCLAKVAGKNESGWWAYWEANEMELCIAAIAALEGE